MRSELQALMRLLPEALLLVRPNGTVVEANPAALKLFDVAPGELEGRALHELVAESSERVAAVLQDATGTAHPIPGTLHIPSVSAPLRKLRVDAARLPIESPDNEPLIYVRLMPAEAAPSQFALLNRKLAELATEVAERRRIEGIVRGQRDVLELMLHGASLEQVLDQLLRIVEERSDRKLLASILLVGDNGRRLYHGAAPSLPREYIDAIDGLEIGPAAGSCGTAAFRRSTVVASNIATDPRWAAYKDIALAHGLRSCWSTPLFATNGDVLGTFAMYYPTSREPNAADFQLVQLVTRTASIAIERKRSEQERADLLERERSARATAEEASRLKDEFLMTVSHELRTPLNAILGWAQLLQSAPLVDEELERALDTIVRNARTQAQIIDDLLSVSRIITGRLRLHVRRMDMREVIHDVLGTLRTAAESKRINLQPELEGDGAMLGDPDRLHQVVWNVLSNAVKFTPEGGTVRIRMSREDGSIELTVSDTGCGVAPDILPFIFERFRQADSSSSRPYGGLGLGLALVRHLVELHGGEVSASSEGVGKGLKVTLRLPVAEQAPRDRAGDRNREGATSRRAKSPPGTS